jgi:predicted anti-sigma-YlaC factor YlaD
MAPPLSKPVSCAEVDELVEPYLDGELSDGLQASIQQHLQGCADCSSEVELAATIRRELHELPQFELSDRTVAAIRETAGVQAHGLVRAGWLARNRSALTVLAAAAVVAIAAAGVLLVGSGPQPKAPAEQAEVDRATAEARLAFALIADATRRAEGELVDGVLRERVLATAVRGISRSFRLSTGGVSETPPPPDHQPTPEKGGLI